MNKPIELVQGDTRPTLVVNLSDENTGGPINLEGAIVRMYFREIDAQELTDTLVGVVLDNATGLCKFDWNVDSLSGPAGVYEGEFEVTFPDGKIQSVYTVQRFVMRQGF